MNNNAVSNSNLDLSIKARSSKSNMDFHDRNYNESQGKINSLRAETAQLREQGVGKSNVNVVNSNERLIAQKENQLLFHEGEKSDAMKLFEEFTRKIEGGSNDKSGNPLESMAKAFGQLLNGGMDKFSEGFGKMASSLGGLISKGAEAFSSVVGSLSNAFSNGANSLGNMANGLMSGLGSLLGQGAQAVNGLMSGAGNLLGSGMNMMRGLLG